MKQKRSVALVVFAAIFCLLLSGCGKDEPSSEDRTGQTGVITEACDIHFFDLRIEQECTYPLRGGELMLILDEKDGQYHVQAAVTELPVLAGYVDKKFVSFDPADIQNASSGMVRNVTVYEAPSSDAAVKFENYSSAIIIDWREGGFARCSLPGGNIGWIRESDLQYEIEKAYWTVEMESQEYPE